MKRHLDALQRLNEALAENLSIDVACAARCVEQGLLEDNGSGRYRLTRKGEHLLSTCGRATQALSTPTPWAIRPARLTG